MAQMIPLCFSSLLAMRGKKFYMLKINMYTHTHK